MSLMTNCAFRSDDDEIDFDLLHLLYRLVFKKRLFLGERPLHSACVAEMELLYYQVLHAVRHDRLPIETDEAVRIYLILLAYLILVHSRYKLVFTKGT